MGQLKINRQDNGAVSIQVDDLSPVYHSNLKDVTVKANRQTENGIAIINERIGVLVYDLDDIVEINGAPAPADRDDAIAKIANEVFTRPVI